MKGYNKFNAVREDIGDNALLNELMMILNDDQLNEFADDLIRNFDLDIDEVADIVTELEGELV